jgi:gas vesicle protein
VESERDTPVISFIAGLALGAAIGAAIALLAAPNSGRVTRKRIGRAAGELRDTAGKQWDDLTDDIKDRVGDAVKVARKRLS